MIRSQQPERKMLGCKPEVSCSASHTCAARSTTSGSTLANKPHLNPQYNNAMATYFVENFGCRATQADGAALERQLRERGLTRADSTTQAEVIVLNTCTVTASADQDA